MGVGGKGGEGEGKRQGGGSCEFSKEAQLRLAYLRGRVPSRMCSQSPPSWSACACSCALSIMPSAHRQAGRAPAGGGGGGGTRQATRNPSRGGAAPTRP